MHVHNGANKINELFGVIPLAIIYYQDSKCGLLLWRAPPANIHTHAQAHTCRRFELAESGNEEVAHMHIIETLCKSKDFAQLYSHFSARRRRHPAFIVIGAQFSLATRPLILPFFAGSSFNIIYSVLSIFDEIILTSSYILQHNEDEILMETYHM